MVFEKSTATHLLMLLDSQYPYQKRSFARIQTAFGHSAVSGLEPQNVLSQWIGNFIKNIPGVKPEEVEIDSEQVIRSVEAQHGFFVECAEGIYSFTHLTWPRTNNTVTSRKQTLKE